MWFGQGKGVYLERRRVRTRRVDRRRLRAEAAPQLGELRLRRCHLRGRGGGELVDHALLLAHDGAERVDLGLLRVERRALRLAEPLEPAPLRRLRLAARGERGLVLLVHLEGELLELGEEIVRLLA